MRVSIVLIGMGLALGFATSVWAKGPPKCYSDKMKAAGKYSFCRLKAQSKIPPLAGQAADYSKCDSQFSKKWQKAEDRAGGACPTDGDEAAIQAEMIGDADTILARLSGVRFVANRDGTVTDNQTGLMWEMKEEDPNSLHFVNDTYNWFDAMSDWISEVNGHTDDPNTRSGLGGHSDWRIPNIVELRTIVDLSAPGGIDPVFGPTALSSYWSSTTGIGEPPTEFDLTLPDGTTSQTNRSSTLHVRAVRGP